MIFYQRDDDVHQSDGLWKETLHMSGCSSAQCSVASTRQEETLEQVKSRA